MQLQSKNINKVRVVTLCYIEILLQIVFRVWFVYLTLHWAVNNIHARVNSIQSCSGRFDSIRNQLTVDS